MRSHLWVLKIKDSGEEGSCKNRFYFIVFASLHNHFTPNLLNSEAFASLPDEMFIFLRALQKRVKGSKNLEVGKSLVRSSKWTNQICYCKFRPESMRLPLGLPSDVIYAPRCSTKLLPKLVSGKTEQSSVKNAATASGSFGNIWKSSVLFYVFFWVR